jgi:hypothetical protein
MNESNDVKESKQSKLKAKRSQKAADKSPKIRKKRKPKDPDAPKRPLGAYFYYFKALNSTVKELHPEFIQKEVVAKIARDWKELSVEQKQPYVEKSNLDKQRYVVDKKEFDERKQKEEEGVGNEEDKVNHAKKENKRVKTTPTRGYDKAGIKRPKQETAFSVADEKEVRLKDIIGLDQASFPSDSEELAAYSPPGSADGRARLMINAVHQLLEPQAIVRPELVTPNLQAHEENIQSKF